MTSCSLSWWDVNVLEGEFGLASIETERFIDDTWDDEWDMTVFERENDNAGLFLSKGFMSFFSNIRQMVFICFGSNVSMLRSSNSVLYGPRGSEERAIVRHGFGILRI